MIYNKAGPQKKVRWGGLVYVHIHNRPNIYYQITMVADVYPSDHLLERVTHEAKTRDFGITDVERNWGVVRFVRVVCHSPLFSL